MIMGYRWGAVFGALVVLASCGQNDDRVGAPASSAAVAPTRAPVTPSAPPGSSAAPPSTSPTSPSPTSTPPAPGRFPACEELPVVAAPADWYRDRPVYVGGDQPVRQVQAWARLQPSFQQLWLDNDRFGWITLAFTADAEARQAELQAKFPDVGVVAVEVPTTLAELNAVRRRAQRLLEEAGIEFAGSGSSVTQWMVELYVNASDERVTAALAPLAAERICLSDTGAPTPEGPQPQSGDGWRLLGDELVGESYRTGIATNETQYDDLWRHVGMTTERPAVDFTGEVVVWFGAVYGSSCPIRLDDVVIDAGGERGLVHAVTVVPGGTGACTADANPHAYIVAVERDELPAGPFAIQLGPDDPPVGVPEERTLVDADLTGPGVVATADQIGPDRDLIAASRRPQPVESGGYIESGFPSPYRFYAYCGIAVLGQLNGTWWMTGTDAVSVPAEWAGLVDPESQMIPVRVRMTSGPDPTVTATANGYSVTYQPVLADAVPSCD
jgi:hypothetical protein